MRIAFALPLLLLGACQAEVDETNDSVTLQYDENTAESVADETGQFASDVANDVGQTADQVQNEVGDVDVDVETGADANAN